MPQCCVGEKCLCPAAPLDGRHLCAICKEQLHGPCGIFNGDDSAITYRNRCFSCGDPNEGGTLSTPTMHCNIITHQSTIVSAKDIDPKKVSWVNIVAGDRPSVKPGESGQMVKSVAIICGIDAMTLSTEQLHLICASLKLSGYRSKPKAELLRIIGVGCLHQALSATYLNVGSAAEAEKVAAKTRNCSFRLINVLFSDEISPKFEKVGEQKDKELMDSGLLSNDDFFLAGSSREVSGGQ